MPFDALPETLTACPICEARQETRSDCGVCGGTGAVSASIAADYDTCPVCIDAPRYVAARCQCCGGLGVCHGDDVLDYDAEEPEHARSVR